MQESSCNHYVGTWGNDKGDIRTGESIASFQLDLISDEIHYYDL